MSSTTLFGKGYVLHVGWKWKGRSTLFPQWVDEVEAHKKIILDSPSKFISQVQHFV
jgi:hypothetical protein